MRIIHQWGDRSLLGFVEVSNTDDPCQVGFSFAESNWVMTQKTSIVSPATLNPSSPKSLPMPRHHLPLHRRRHPPFGVVYQAFDGIRIFDGNTSTLIGSRRSAPSSAGKPWKTSARSLVWWRPTPKRIYIIS